MEMEVMKYNREKGGWINFAAMGFWSLLLYLPFVSNFGARKLFSQVMKNYYFDPASAPDPPESFLSGISAQAMIRSKHAFLRDVKERISWDERIPSYCIFGDDDIYDFKGKTEMLPHCSHLSWIDQPKRLESLLKSFYGAI
jgi:pimeloyl-ACP methyl ester carboxylesterase